MTVVGLHPEELFDKLLAGELSASDRARLRTHLDACEVCRFEHAARLDFHEEALALAAMSAPPALPLRPPAAQDAPLPVAKPRRRRGRGLVWGLAAAALISASAAVASGLAGKAPWRVVSSLLVRTATPVARSVSTPVKAPVARAPVAAAPSEVAPAAEAAPSEVAPAEAAPSEVAPVPTARSGATPVPESARHLQGAVKRAAVSSASLQIAPSASTSEATPKSDVSKESGAKEPAVKEAPSASKLFGEANQARRSGDIGRASGLYHLLQDQFPSSPEAELSRVTLALLLLDSGDAQGALSGFERYLAGSSRALEAEALVGRARALGRLGRRDLEAAAWREVQRKYPRSIYGRQASERLLALGLP